MQLLFGTGHGVVGRTTADVASLATSGSRARRALGGQRAFVGVGHAVVLKELDLVALGELSVRLDAGGALHLLVGNRHLHVFALRRRASQRHERPLGAEQPGVYARPLGLVALVVEVQLVDLADLLTVPVDHRTIAPAISARHFGHCLTSSVVS